MKKLVAVFFLVLWGVFTLPAHAALLDAKSNEGVVYLADNASTEVKRYSLSSSSFLSSITLSSIPTALHVDPSGLYFSYGTSIVHFNLDGSNETSLRTTSKTISDIESIDNVLILSGNSYLQTINKNTGLFIDEASFSNTSSQIVADKNSGFVFVRSSGVSPSDINQIPIDASGNIGTKTDSPYHGTYPGGSKCFIFPTQSRVLDTSGTIYNTLDLTYSANIGGAFTDIDFWNGLPIVLRSGSLYAYDKALQQTGTHSLTMTTAARIFVYADNAFVFSSDQATVETVAVSLLKPADPTAAIDPTNLVYTPDSQVMNADNDTVYLLSRGHLNIFRWSISQQAYLDSISLTNAPKEMSYSPEHNRIYLSYAGGVLNYIDLTDGLEYPFVTVVNGIGTIESVGDYVFVRDAAGSWGTFITYNIDGVIKSSNGLSYPTSNVVWNSQLNRIYYISGFSPADLHWQSLDPITGILSSKRDSPYHSSAGWRNPIRLSANGKYVAVGSGRVLDSEVMSELGYATTSGVSAILKDLVWLHGNVFTLRSADSNTTTILERWQADFDPEIAATYQLTAKPIGLLPLYNNGSILLIYSVTGMPQFEVRTFAPIDSDGDTYLDPVDAFPADPTEWEDLDSDGIGNNADLDDDGDGVNDDVDPFPLDSTEWEDTDLDGIGNNADTNDDNDSALDVNDAFPTDPLETLDTDSDGIGNNADVDDDGDAVNDDLDPFPLDSTEWEDTDLDGIGNNADTNDDNDSALDVNDAFPTDPLETLDTDNDGIGNNADVDDDGDGVNDELDPFPLDSIEWLDTDGDGIGDVADPDADNDGVLDTNDFHPTDPTKSELDASNYLPLNPGSTWFYDTMGSNAVTVDSPISIAGKSISPLSFPNGSRLYLKDSPTQIHFYGVYLANVATPYGTFSADFKVSQGLPLLVSGSMSGTGNVNIQPTYGNRTLNWTASTTFLGVESLTLDAGVFNAIHVQVNFSGTATVEGATVVVQYNTDFWFADGVGIVRMTESGVTSNLVSNSITTTPEANVDSSNGGGGGSLNLYFLLLVLLPALLRYMSNNSSSYRL